MVCSSAPHSQATGGHTPFVQAGAEASNTSTEANKTDPGCSWEGHSRRVSASIEDGSAESRKVAQPLRIPLVIRPVCRTFVVLVVR